MSEGLQSAMELMEFNSLNRKAKPQRGKTPEGLSRISLVSAVLPPACCCCLPAVLGLV